MFNDFFKQSKPVKIMCLSDFFELLASSFVGPTVTKGIYGSDKVTTWMLAASTVASCLATILWNKIYNEKNRYRVFQKTYLFGLIGYSIGTTLAGILGSKCSVAVYFWVELGVGVKLGKVWGQGNMELFGNLFSTEERKTYERMHSSLCSIAELSGCTIAMILGFQKNIPLSIALVIWCTTFFMDASSMSYLFIYCNKRGQLKPRN